MSEQNLTRYVKKGAKGYGHICRHEDGGAPGQPDISYGILKVNGWIECKWKKEWPARPNTAVRFNHFTPQQRLWLRQRGRTGGHCWVLIQVDKEWLLFRWDYAVEHLGTATRDQLYLAAVGHWEGAINWAELARMLSREER